MRRPTQTLCLLLVVTCCAAEFTIPEATLEFLHPRGLKISIPDTDPDVTLVAYHININEEFQGVEAGRWAADVLKRSQGIWTYTFHQFRAKKGDTVNYWVYAIKNGLGYQDLDRSYRVTQENPHGPPESTTTKRPLPPPPPTEPPSPLPVDWRDCNPSQTTVRGTASPCAGRAVFNATFLSDRDLAQWRHEIYVGGERLDEDFTIFTKDNDVSRVFIGQLHISPLLLEKKYSTEFVTAGTLDLAGCTARNENSCSARAAAYLILPPVLSARLTTRESFSFRYGTVEIKAKLPKGDWIVPELWLEPKTRHYGMYSGRIVMGLSRGNERLIVEGNDIGSRLLETGVLLNSTHGPTFQRTRQDSWADDFHVFKLLWTSDVLEFSVDDQQVGRIAPETVLSPSLSTAFKDTTKLSPFDQEFYISLGVHVGGLTAFPDSVVSGDHQKPWKNSNPKARLRFWQSKDQWFPSWTSDSALLVEHVKVSAL